MSAKQVLYGIVSGIVADGDLTDLEIKFLSTWLAENRELRSSWPGSVIASRVDAVLEDGKIESDERDHLLMVLKDIAGMDFGDTGTATAEPVTIPIDDQVDVEIKGKSFVLTGQFAFGTRGACEAAVVQAGGACLGSVTKKLDVLVIGSMATRDWANASYGRKIETAARLKANGASISIISEQRWVAAIEAANKHQ